ncbi:hypothetical protein EB796_012671 [Bugula neritina]|uniref:Uncharacterized protein n=1 Tax=Bugula neritina TaxID=10212 RepID=A0A7J7JSR6_BUGNE|nr:hypothetical protein EB796_012671 [Bugula neritina]
MSQPPAFIQHVVELIRGGRQTFPITTSLLVTTLTIILLLKLCEERTWVSYTLTSCKPHGLTTSTLPLLPRLPTSCTLNQREHDSHQDHFLCHL